MKHFLPCILLSLMLVSACGTMTFDESTEEEEVATDSGIGEKTMFFRLTGITMTDITEMTSGEGNTKAANTAQDGTDNLLLGIYNTDGAIVGNISYQHKDDPYITYGTFSQTLKHGKYTILAIGWNGTQQCHVHSLDSITFSEGWVPNTFLCLQNIVVSENFSDTRTLSLKRCVSRFKLTMNDEYIPEGIGSFHISMGKSSNNLDSRTRHCNHIRTHERTIPVNGELTPPIRVTAYCFLPQDSTGVDITITACDPDGNPMESKEFTNVPMKINYSTNYSGNFFPYSSESGSVTFENEFDGEIFHDF